jgi:hypothetical protein
MVYLRKYLNLKIAAIVFIFSLLPAGFIAAGDETDSFHFTVTADMRTNHEQFREVCRVINQKMGGPGAFHISAGDTEPEAKNRKIIDEEFGADAIWYPVVGNHESENDMKWIRGAFHSLPYIVNDGPVKCEETTYSFDYKNAHFVILNEYYNGIEDKKTDGDIVPELLGWLKNDLDKNTKPFIFVFGHEPAFPMPDEYWKNERHYGDSLDKYAGNRDAFWDLLEDKHVIAYICGHTHRYSHYQRERGKVWQITVGSRPYPENTSKYDALLNVIVSGSDVKFEVYRDLDGDGEYIIYDSWLAGEGT